MTVNDLGELVANTTLLLVGGDKQTTITYVVRSRGHKSVTLDVKFVTWGLLNSMIVRFPHAKKDTEWRERHVKDLLSSGQLTIEGDAPHWYAKALTKSDTKEFLDVLEEAIRKKNLKPDFPLSGFTLHEITDGVNLWYKNPHTHIHVQAAKMGHMNGRKKLERFILDVYSPQEKKS